MAPLLTGLIACSLVSGAGFCAEANLEGYSPDISALDARLKLARILSYDYSTLRQSEAEYRKVLKDIPQNRRIQLELAHVLVMRGKRDAALLLVDGILAKNPGSQSALAVKGRIYAWSGEMNEASKIASSIKVGSLRNPENLLALADLYAFLGLSAQAWETFGRALKSTRRKSEFRFAFAASMMELGDLYEAEDACRSWLKARGQDRSAQIRLAEVLAAMGRAGESAQIYKGIILDDPKYPPALLGLARLREKEGMYEAAAEAASRALALDTGDREAVAIRARARYLQGKLEESIEDYQLLSKLEPDNVRGSLGAARAYCRMGRAEDAQREFDAAGRIDPQAPGVIYHAERATAGAGEIRCIRAERLPVSASSRDLAELGRLHQEDGDAGLAAHFYRLALEEDSSNYPLRLRLAEVLAAERKFAESVGILEGLLKERPGNYRALSLKARVLGQAGRYDEAIKQLDRMSKLGPGDPMPVLEKARIASWAGRMALAMETYGKLLEEPVDKSLKDGMAAAAQSSRTVAKLHERLKSDIARGSLYEGYAEMERALGDPSLNLSKAMKKRLQEIMNRRYGSFYMTRLAAMEMRAKRNYLRGMYGEAMADYEKLIAAYPGNTGAMFEYSQAACALGRCREESRGYEMLLRSAPMHKAGRAVQTAVEARRHPAASVSHLYLEEEGRGQLSGMARNDLAGSFEVPVICRLRLRVGSGWREERFSKGNTRPRSRFGSAGAAGSLSSRIAFGGEWRYIEYEDSEISPRHLGSGRIDLGLGGGFEAGVSYERTEESHNRQAFSREIMADNWSARGGVRFGRKWHAGANYRYTDLTDSNSMHSAGMRLGRAFGGWQRRLTVSGLGEYRDTESPSSQFVDLKSIEHPYWTPTDHLDGSIAAEWRHDLSGYPYCGAPAKNYRIEARIGSNSEDDIYGRGELGVDWDMTRDWFFALKGMIYNSREWRAASVWSSLGCRF